MGMIYHEIIYKIVSLISYYIHFLSESFVTLVECIWLKLIGVHIGHNPKFKGWCSFFLTPGCKVSIGNNAHFNSWQYTNHIGINHRCVIACMKKNAKILVGDNFGMSGTSICSFSSIVIGNNVRVGANCVIADSDFHLNDIRSGEPHPIVIEDNVWLGYGVIVKKGVTIGANSVIGMNSIVTHDIPANSVAAGSPCKVLKTVEGLIRSES